MLNVKSLKGSASAIAGYLTKNQERSGEKGYYQKSESAPSRWQGRGAEMLGLKGHIDPETFMKLLEDGPAGMPPATADRRKGVDLTWSVPKSVSMLIESAPPEQRERLLELCREANSVAMQHIEDHVVSARYGKGGAVSEKTGCAIIATFEHDDARPVLQPDGTMKIDPDRHFHNILINATQDADGWRSMDLDMGALSVEQHLADLKGKAHLAAGLQKMGIATEKTKDGFEVAGISREQIEKCSGRGMQLEAELEKQGKSRETSTASERNAINQTGKLNKIRDLSQIDLRYQWREDLRAVGVDFDKLYDASRDLSAISKSGQESTKDAPDFNTEPFSRSTNPTEKEQDHEQRDGRSDDFFSRHFQHKPDDELYPEPVEHDGHGDGMQPLSGSRLDAVEIGKSPVFLPDYAQADRSANRLVRRQPADREVTEEKARQAIDAALDHLSEKDSLFDRRQLALEAIKQGMGEVSGADIEAVMATHGRIVWAGEQTKTIEQKKTGKDGESYVKKTQIRAEMVTTTETVAREGWIQGFCQEGRGKLSPLMTPEAAASAAKAAERKQGFSFADDQRQAVIATLTSEDRVSAMIGGAGTGKTTAMKSMVDAAREMGFETVGLTPSHGARQELLDAGTDKNVTTATFLMQKTKEDQKPRLYILDESGMVGDRTMQQVFQKMGPRDRILLSGDDAQTKPQEAGDPLKTLVDKGLIARCSLTRVQRQAKAEDKTLLEIGQAWADRDPARALELSRKYMTQVHVTGTGPIDRKTGLPKITTDDRRKAIAEGVVSNFMQRSPEDRERTMVVCPTNQVRGLVNNDIHEQLQTSGALPQNAIEITHLTAARLSKAHMKQAHQYTEGQIMKTREGKGAEAKVVDYEIMKVDGQHNTLTIKSADGAEKTIDASKIDPKKWTAFNKQGGMGLAVGEKLIMRDNSIEGAQNGDVGKISSISDGKITVAMERGQTVVLDATKPQAVDYGYARTIPDSQGKSPDLTLESGEKSGGDSANTRGVAQTRMRDGYACVTDDIEGYIARALKYAEKNIAQEARKNADLQTDRRLDRLESILENGKERGAQDVEKQLNPERQEQGQGFGQKRDAANASATAAGATLGDLSAIPDPLDPDLGSPKFGQKMDAAMENIERKQGAADMAESAALNNNSAGRDDAPDSQTESETPPALTPEPEPEPELER